MTTDSHIRRSVQENVLNRNIFHDVRSPGFIAKWPIAGLMMFLLGILTFGALAYNVRTNAPLLQWDLATAKTLHADATNIPPSLVEYILFGFFVGKEIVLMIGTILATYFLYKRFWRELGMLWISSAVGSVVWNFIVAYFARPRSPQQTGLVITTIPSFPSGHAMSALICYGFFIY